METLSIRSKKPFSLVVLEKTLSQYWRIENLPDDTLAVHGNETRAYLYLDSEDGENGEFQILIDYSDVGLAKSLLEKLADSPVVTVDNDFGTIMAGDQFVARCKANTKWDWRLSGIVNAVV